MTHGTLIFVVFFQLWTGLVYGEDPTQYIGLPKPYTLGLYGWEPLQIDGEGAANEPGEEKAPIQNSGVGSMPSINSAKVIPKLSKWKYEFDEECNSQAECNLKFKAKALDQLGNNIGIELEGKMLTNSRGAQVQTLNVISKPETQQNPFTLTPEKPTTPYDSLLLRTAFEADANAHLLKSLKSK